MAVPGSVKPEFAPIDGGGGKGKKEEREPRREREKKKREFPGEVPPKPVAEKFPGEPSPYPVGYTPPEGKTVEVDAKGRPTVIETSAGLRQYTPNSTMFKMGYVNSDQYLKSGAARGDKTVMATAFLPIKAETGRQLMIAKEVAFTLQGRTPREQFNALKEMGVIERGSRFIPSTDGEWSYQTARNVKARERKAAELSQWATKTTIAEIKGMADALKDTTILPDGIPVANTEIAKVRNISPAAYKILIEQGYGAYVEALSNSKKALSGYYDPEKDEYNVQGALLRRNEGINEAVGILFNQKEVEDIKTKILPGLTIGTGVDYPKRTPAKPDKITRYGGDYSPEYDIPPQSREQAIIVARARVEKISQPFIALADKAARFIDDYKDRLSQSYDIVSEKVQTELEKAYERQQRYRIEATPEMDLPPASRQEAIETAQARAAAIIEPLKAELKIVQERGAERLNTLAGYLEDYAEERQKVISDALEEAFKAQQKYKTDISPELDMPPESRRVAIETAQARIDALDKNTEKEIDKAQAELNAIADRYQQSGEIMGGKLEQVLEDSFKKQQKYKTDISPSADLPPESREAAVALAKARAAAILEPLKETADKLRPDFSKLTEPIKQEAGKSGDKINDILEESYQKQQRAYKPPKEAWLAAGAAVVVPEPVSTVLGIATLAALAGYTVYNVKKNNIDLSQIPQQVRDEYNAYIQKMKGYYLNIKDAVAVKNGQATSVTELDPKLRHGEQLIPPSLYGLKPGEQLIPPQLEALRRQPSLTPPQIQQLQETIKQYNPEIVYLPTPMTDITDITGAKAGVMAAQAGVAVAERELEGRTKEVVQGLPANLKFLLEPSDGAEDIVIPRRDITTWTDNPPVFPADRPSQVSPDLYEQKKQHWMDEMVRITSLQQNADIRHAYNAALRNYLQRLAIYEDAKKSYVQSLNPQPVSGTASKESLAVYSDYLISQLGKEKAKPLTKGFIEALESEATKAYTQALTEGATASRAKTAAITAAITKAETLAEPVPLTKAEVKTIAKTVAKTVARTAAKPVARTAVKPVVRPAVKPVVRPAVKPAVGPATLTKVAVKPLIKPLKPFILPRGGGTDKEKRKRIKQSSGAIAWRQGELGGKDVWHTLMYPYQSERDYLTVLGRKPTNTTIVKGPGSAYQTIKLRYGKEPSRKVTGDIGFMDFSIEPKGTKKVGIGFKPDPKLETTGDITIGRRVPRLTNRGNMRITPKTPRLRR